MNNISGMVFVVVRCTKYKYQICPLSVDCPVYEYFPDVKCSQVYVVDNCRQIHQVGYSRYLTGLNF